MCLYSEDSTEPRSLLALSHRDSSKLAAGLAAFAFLAGTFLGAAFLFGAFLLKDVLVEAEYHEQSQLS